MELGTNQGSIKGVGEQRPVHALIERLSVPPPRGLTQGAKEVEVGRTKGTQRAKHWVHC